MSGDAFRINEAFNLVGAQEAHETDLPAYAGRGEEPDQTPLAVTEELINSEGAHSEPLPAHTSHPMKLLDKKGRTWAVLHLRSRASASNKMPVLMESDPIEGSVTLNLLKDDGIVSVCISVSALQWFLHRGLFCSLGQWQTFFWSRYGRLYLFH